MKATELRINNYVSWGLRLASIKGIHTDTITKSDVHFYINILDNENLNYYPVSDDGVEPILITEDWLLKLGFKLVTKEGNQGEFKIYSLNEISFNTLHGWWWKHRLDVQPKYVHQLQNLFFALTGQELEINDLEQGWKDLENSGLDKPFQGI